MDTRFFLILHGLGGSPEGHWQHWLAARLEAAGERVLFPGLPDSDDPDPPAWEQELERALGESGGERVVLAHSLGCVLWLRRASRADGPLAERVLLVAPPSTDEVEPVVRFAAFEPRPDAIARACPETRIVCSDDDPYNPRGALATHAEPLGLPADLVAGGGHINIDAGFGAWPAVERWALDGRTPLRAPAA